LDQAVARTGWGGEGNEWTKEFQTGNGEEAWKREFKKAQERARVVRRQRAKAVVPRPPDGSDFGTTEIIPAIFNTLRLALIFSPGGCIF
jgi:hypothetical protein